MTDSIKGALAETKRRRDMQMEFNREHGITPQTIVKPIKEKEADITDTKHIPRVDIPNYLIELEQEMQAAADSLDFERAIKVRDQIKKIKKDYDL